MDRTERGSPPLNGEEAAFRKATPSSSRSAKTLRNHKAQTATDQATAELHPRNALRGTSGGSAMADVTFISEKTRESFRARRSRALEAALRCAREASKPGTDQARAIALLCAVGRYAEQLRPAPGVEGAR